MWRLFAPGEESHEVKKENATDWRWLRSSECPPSQVSSSVETENHRQMISSDAMMSIQAYVLLLVALLQCHRQAEWRKTTFWPLFYPTWVIFTLKRGPRTSPQSLSSPRGRRREPTLSPARGGWLQLPAGLRLGRDLRHGLHQQSEEGEDCLVLGLNMRFVESHHCVYMPGSLLELQSMNFAAPQRISRCINTLPDKISTSRRNKILASNL